MDQYCGNVIDMSVQNIEYGRLAVDGYSTGDCNVTIAAWTSTNRLHFRFDVFNFEDCSKSYLTVFDGRAFETDSKIHGT